MSNDSRPQVDDIPCPFLAAAYNHGDLVCAEDGTTSEEALEEALAAAGIERGLRQLLAGGATKKTEGPADQVNLFELRQSAVDHTGNTGIRDPEVDAEKLPTLLGFGEDGRMYTRHFAAAANHYRLGDPGAKGTATETVEMSALILVFGRTDENGKRYLTDEDLRSLWVEARYPSDWTPPAAGSITKKDLLKKAAEMGAMRLAIRVKKDATSAAQTVTDAVKDLLQ